MKTMGPAIWLAALAVSCGSVPGVGAVDEPAGSASAPSVPGTVSAGEGVDTGAIRERVLQRHGLAAQLEENKLPWYFFYEYGVELINHGRAADAIEALQMAANLKPVPARRTRMYGMWFVDYLPYYHLARAHAQLAAWDRAWDALRLSEEMDEFGPEDLGYEDYRDLKASILRHLQ